MTDAAKEVIEELTESNPDALTADGLDDALVGVVVRQDSGIVALYSIERIIAIYMVRDKMDKETAEEFFNFNVAGAYVGENGPVFAFVEYGGKK